MGHITGIGFTRQLLANGAQGTANAAQRTDGRDAIRGDIAAIRAGSTPTAVAQDGAAGVGPRQALRVDARDQVRDGVDSLRDARDSRLDTWAAQRGAVPSERWAQRELVTDFRETRRSAQELRRDAVQGASTDERTANRHEVRAGITETVGNLRMLHAARTTGTTGTA